MVALDVSAAAWADRSAAAAGRAARAVLALVAAGLWGAGWLLAKTVHLVLLVLGGSLWAVGWAARRVVWPGLVWAATAVRVGWEDGRKRAETS